MERPMYLEMVDLLLRQADAAPTEEAKQPFLLEAREVVELMKVSELRDYFEDDCLAAVRFSSHQARYRPPRPRLSFTPIMLPDRTEVIVSLPSGLKKYTLAAAPDDLVEEIRLLRRNLEKRTTREYLPHAQHIHDILIKPIEADLAAIQADTLVLCPGRPPGGPSPWPPFTTAGNSWWKNTPWPSPPGWT